MDDRCEDQAPPNACAEWVFEATPGFEHRCSRSARRVVNGRWLCEQHAKMAERWETPRG